MSREKYSYTNNAELIHLFSNGVEREIYSRNMRVKINNGIKRAYLISYNTIIAIHDKESNTFLLSTESYSVTTSSQQWELKSSIWSNEIFIPNVNNGREDNIKEIGEEIKAYLKKVERSRKESTREDYISSALSLLSELKKYLIFLKVDKRKYNKYLKIEKSLEGIKSFYSVEIKREQKEKEKEKRAYIKREKERKAFRASHREKLLSTIEERKEKLLQYKRIMRGAFHSERKKLFRDVSYLFREELRELNNFDIFLEPLLYSERDYLRLSEKGNIITSQRVTISKKEALRVIKLYKLSELKRESRIDNFRVREINNDFMTIGCHKIDIKEIESLITKIERGA